MWGGMRRRVKTTKTLFFCCRFDDVVLLCVRKVCCPYAKSNAIPPRRVRSSAKKLRQLLPIRQITKNNYCEGNRSDDGRRARRGEKKEADEKWKNSKCLGDDYRRWREKNSSWRNFIASKCTRGGDDTAVDFRDRRAITFTTQHANFRSSWPRLYSSHCKISARAKGKKKNARKNSDEMKINVNSEFLIRRIHRCGVHFRYLECVLTIFTCLTRELCAFKVIASRFDESTAIK